MNANFLFDVDAYRKHPRRYVVRPTRLSRHPGIEQALTRLKQTIDALPRESLGKKRTV
jgi:hypothetical protein